MKIPRQDSGVVRDKRLLPNTARVFLSTRLRSGVTPSLKSAPAQIAPRRSQLIIPPQRSCVERY